MHLQTAETGQVPAQRGERERNPSRPATTQEQQQQAQTPQRFRMNSPEQAQRLLGAATAPYAHAPPPPPKNGAPSMPGSPTSPAQEVFSTSQLTEIAQIVFFEFESGDG